MLPYSMKLLPILVLSGILLPAIRSARSGEPPAPHPVEVKVGALVDAARSTADFMAAYGKGSELWDAELNRIYQALRKALPAPASEKLKLAQQQWLLYRDASYALLDEQYNQYEGTLYLPMRVAARMRVTEDRARYLTLLLETQKEHGAQ